MKKKNIIRVATICMTAAMAFTPINASAASLLRKGSRGYEVKQVQMTLQELGYFTYPKATGYFGNITLNAVRKFQRDNGIKQDGLVGRLTKSALSEKEENTEASEITNLSVNKVKAATAGDIASYKKGDLNWFSKVQYIFGRGDVAVITDVNTGRTFRLQRTYGTNHADVEPLTKKDANIIKDIWGGWTWTRRAVVVEIDGYALAGSLAAMPHAGVDSKPAVKYVSGRSGGYGWGQNLDEVKNNGVSGVLDLHFKKSRTHGTNKVNNKHQNMVNKAAKYIDNNY
ncbi:MAG TPA: peptidoglycan-binding domain-containing protein [Mobilitalea sp.]|nr:peptidoglycan-binding domain-containing protein [Mobilitalea sp.]